MSTTYKLTHKDPKGVTWTAKITDRNNPYNVQYTIVDNGNGTITITFSFLPLPPDATGTSIGYSTDGINFLSNTGGVVSPRSITLPAAVYFFQFVVQRPGGNEIFVLNGPTDIKPITGSADSIKITGINNEEDEFAIIRGKQATIQFISTSNINLNNFLSGIVYNNRFYVEISVNTEDNIVFKGFLSTDDLSEPFLSPSNVVTLTASDKLASLKTVPMTNFDGKNPSGYYTIAKYIAYCLRKTGLSLKINVISNLREANHNDRTWFDTVYLWSKTFEAEIGTCKDCSSCLEIILNKHGVLWQRNGEWYIRWVDEWDQQPVYINKFDEYGELIEVLPGNRFDKVIKRENPIYFSQKRTSVFGVGQYKSTKLTFKYELPKELICNIDFSRGNYIDNVSSSEKRFDIECWTLRQGVPGFYGAVVGTTATIRRKYNAFDYEIERYVCLTPRTTFENSSINQATYIESEFVPVVQKDRFTASIDYRIPVGIASGGGGYRLFRCVLNGDDGSWWILGRPSDISGTDDTVQWYNTNGWTTNSARGKVTIDFDTADETQWANIEWNSPPVPVSGKLYFWLNQFNQSNVSGDDKDIHYSNLQFTYYPLINGSYRKFTGQYHKVTQAADFTPVVDEEVFISDSPCRLYKGSLFRKVGDEFVLAGNFYPASVFHDNPPSNEFYHPFGYIQVFAVMNQVRQVKRLFRGSMQGLDAASVDPLGKCNMPDTMHAFQLNDQSPHTKDRDFMLLSFDMNTKWSGWTGTLKEIYHRVNGKVYSDQYEFKYLS